MSAKLPLQEYVVGDGEKYMLVSAIDILAEDIVPFRLKVYAWLRAENVRCTVALADIPAWVIITVSAYAEPVDGVLVPI